MNNLRTMTTCAGICAVVFAISLMLGVGSASAIKPGGADAPDCGDLVQNVCYDELAVLCMATDDAESLKDRDRNTLVSKVLGAGIKLSQGKPDDADRKLGDYESKLDQLVNAPKPKISESDADDLSEALWDAQSCVLEQGGHP